MVYGILAQRVCKLLSTGKLAQEMVDSMQTQSPSNLEHMKCVTCHAEIVCALPQAVQTKQAPPQAITASVLLIVSGCIVAGLGDFSFDIKG